MFFRRRRGRRDPSAAIEAFWRWWATARPRAEKSFAGVADDRLVAEMGTRVSAIHPDLEWEFTAGTDSEHLLVVTAAGSPDLRPLTERWRRAAPPPDAVFGYASSRPGHPEALDGTLAYGPHEIDLDLVRFAAETDEDVVHVQVWHPMFPRLEEGARTQLAFLCLDWLLGEDAVEIWVGEIAVAQAVGPSLTGPQLAALVTGLKPAAGEEERWCNLTGTRHGKPLIAMAQTPLSPARWPGRDLHIRVDVPYRSRDDNGFPGAGALPALHALEDRIAEFADGAVLVAHETCDGVRTTHLYTDRRAAAHALEPLLASWPDGRVKLTVTEDPRWKAVAHLRRC
ncbi:MAG: DUF695 domain-containing protein [Actinoplanes sp.]